MDRLITGVMNNHLIRPSSVVTAKVIHKFSFNYNFAICRKLNDLRMLISDITTHTIGRL